MPARDARKESHIPGEFPENMPGDVRTFLAAVRRRSVSRPDLLAAALERISLDFLDPTGREQANSHLARIVQSRTFHV